MISSAYVSGAFDNLRSRDIRFLEEVSKLGEVTVLLWTDRVVTEQHGKPPMFPFEERRYLLESIRYVRSVRPVDALQPGSILPSALAPESGATLLLEPGQDTPANRAAGGVLGLQPRALSEEAWAGFPEAGAIEPAGSSSRKRVIVTGCYDWFHSGHVRFFEEVSALGELYVVVGHDANIRLLKGEGHPLFPATERRYIVGAVRFVKQSLIATGNGWIDAEPEIARIRPQIYAVNEDGDKGGKREFCEKHGIEYIVLKRTPAPGLPRRSSTDLRGF